MESRMSPLAFAATDARAGGMAIQSFGGSEIRKGHGTRVKPRAPCVANPVGRACPAAVPNRDGNQRSLPLHAQRTEHLPRL